MPKKARNYRNDAPLLPWMVFVLKFVAIYNVLCGLGMVFLFREGYRFLHLEIPQFKLPIQVLGVCVGLFGVGYYLVSREPLENRHLLMLGFWSKALGSVIGIYHLAAGRVGLMFLPLLIISDIIYLPPFVIILNRIYRRARERSSRG